MAWRKINRKWFYKSKILKVQQTNNNNIQLEKNSFTFFLNYNDLFNVIKLNKGKEISFR